MGIEDLLKELLTEVKGFRTDLKTIGEENKKHFQEWRDKNLP